MLTGSPFIMKMYEILSILKSCPQLTYHPVYCKGSWNTNCAYNMAVCLQIKFTVFWRVMACCCTAGNKITPYCILNDIEQSTFTIMKTSNLTTFQMYSNFNTRQI